MDFKNLCNKIDVESIKGMFLWLSATVRKFRKNTKNNQ